MEVEVALIHLRLIAAIVVLVYDVDHAALNIVLVSAGQTEVGVEPYLVDFSSVARVVETPLAVTHTGGTAALSFAGTRFSSR